ncbi:MAG: cardiolipin synthase [Rubellimicrobium sp.]|nr:cardiolipin synthase [Rubellimicrobium sp.]
MLDGFNTLPAVILHYTITALVVWRVLLRDNLMPPVRLAWVMVVGLLPALGPLAYLLFGEVRVSRSDRRHARDVERRLRAVWDPDDAHAPIPPKVEPAFAMGRATSDFPPVGGNRATMLPEGDEAMADMIVRIATAVSHVHLLFYIWLPDVTGTAVAEAAIAAARRGVAVRVLVDQLGSRQFIRSDLWQRMQAAGVTCRIALPVGNPLVETLYKRLDLRNHRKIAVIDNRVTWAGSRNCADAAFAIKPRFAPWVDVLMRIEGPVVRQFQAVFLSDWMTHCDEDLSHLLAEAPGPFAGGFTGQVVASGPDQSQSGMSETLTAMLYSAHDRVTITTPYFLPDAALHEAICAAARRGVETTLILPERNDSRIVAAASEGLYLTLLRSGVRLHLFRGGLLHAKIITVDGDIAMVGSANLDRRSFDLNYECNLLLHSAEETAKLDRRQDSYLARSRPVTIAEVRRWHALRRIRNNAMALAGPLL